MAMATTTLGRPFTSNARSGSFSSPTTSLYLDRVQSRFMTLVMILRSQVPLPIFTLTVNMDFGGGVTSSSSVTADDTHNSGVNSAVSDPERLPLLTSAFMQTVQNSFQNLVDALCDQGMIPVRGVAVIVVDIAIGVASVMNSTLRLSPRMPTTTTRLFHDGDDDSENGNFNDDDFIEFHPIRPGTDLSRFFGARARAVTVDNHDDDHESMAMSHSDSDSEGSEFESDSALVMEVEVEVEH